MPFFTFSGRSPTALAAKKLMMAALLLSVLTYIPIYKGMQLCCRKPMWSRSVQCERQDHGSRQAQPLSPDQLPQIGAREEAVNAISPCWLSWSGCR